MSNRRVDSRPPLEVSKAQRPSRVIPCADAVVFSVTQLGFVPDLQQARILVPGSRGIVCCHRQWGKSTTIAAKAVHRAWCRAGSLTVIVAPSLRQSSETVRKAETFVRLLGVRPRGDGDNRVSILLPNGSRIVGLPESEHTIVGFSNVSLLVVDEAARVPDPTYHALRPMLANSGGDLWLVSTPLGKRGFFYEAWHTAPETWTRIRVPVTDNPRISPDYVAEERATLPNSRFAQDYLCEFLQPDNAIFRQEDIDALFTTDIEPMGFLNR